MLKKLKELRDKVQQLDEQAKLLSKEMTDIRQYYKYQNDQTDSISEDLIVTYANMSDLQSLVDSLEELIEYEEEWLGMDEGEEE